MTIGFMASGSATAEMKAIELRDACAALEEAMNGRYSRPNIVRESEKCIHYLEGFNEAMLMYRTTESSPAFLYCMDEQKTLRQAAAVYVKYINGQPQKWDEYAAIMLAMP